MTDTALQAQKVLKALAAPGAVLALRSGGRGRYGVFVDGDRRKRPRGAVSGAQVQALLAQGALYLLGDGIYRLSRAARRLEAGTLPAVEKPIMEEAGAVRVVAGVETPVARLGRLKGSDGAAFLSAAEVAAARRLSADLEEGSRGGMRLSRYGADAGGGGQVGVRGSSGAEAALAFGMEARERARQALAALAPTLRRVAERICLEGLSLEELERLDKWPARSGKVALKLALGQLAVAYQRL